MPSTSAATGCRRLGRRRVRPGSSGLGMAKPGEGGGAAAPVGQTVRRALPAPIRRCSGRRDRPGRGGCSPVLRGARLLFPLGRGGALPSPEARRVTAWSSAGRGALGRGCAAGQTSGRVSTLVRCCTVLVTVRPGPVPSGSDGEAGWSFGLGQGFQDPVDHARIRVGRCFGNLAGRRQARGSPGEEQARIVAIATDLTCGIGSLLRSLRVFELSPLPKNKQMYESAIHLGKQKVRYLRTFRSENAR